MQTKYPIVISIKYRIDYMSRRTILTETAIPKLFCHTFNAVSLQTINLFTTLVLAGEVIIKKELRDVPVQFSLIFVLW